MGTPVAQHASRVYTSADINVTSLLNESLMDIRFVSSLTPDDENELAPALLSAIAALLDRVEFAYTLRIETTGAQVLNHSHPSVRHSAAPKARPQAV